MVPSSPHSSAEQKNQWRGFTLLSAYPVSTSEGHPEGMGVLIESKSRVPLGSEPLPSAVSFKWLLSATKLGGAKPQFLTSWSWEEPSLSLSPPGSG